MDRMADAPESGKINLTEVAAATLRTLEAVGEDPSREGLKKTPDRVARAMDFLTQGYRLDPREILTQALFEHPQNHYEQGCSAQHQPKSHNEMLHSIQPIKKPRRRLAGKNIRPIGSFRVIPEKSFCRER